MKLNVRALALALGMVWGIGVFSLGIMAMFNWGADAVGALSSVYIGYSPTIVGSLIGLVWAFIDGSVCGLLIAWFYNKFSS
ncbi:MAG: hypothetical protein COV45_07745 [Deltaproteobacteria bacterium CG11_big_fil_rev_8_21_14_0_20_47_16]|nr:MAG: hypothetical protein COV45_07745 [Deltaproteobacteria bacterium CG11_big_fil_rev_8_21_14_0_20_47_16]